MNERITRREFVELSAVAFSGFVISGGVTATGRRRQARTLSIATILPVSDAGTTAVADVAAGASLAFSETERAADLFGQKIVLSRERVPRPDQLRAAATALITRNGVAVIIGGTSHDEGLALRAAAEDKRVVFLNIGSSADSLRRNECSPHMFHISAGDSMIDAARTAAVRQLGGAPPGLTIELWDSSLERYGGSQLNDRYRARFNRGMTSAAWAGWIAVKIAWETSLRARSADPAALVAELAKASLQFDGHKGTPLSFRGSDHQLRQPLYAVTHDTGGKGGKRGKVVAELPDVGKGSSEALRDELDRFAGPESTPTCIERK